MIDFFLKKMILAKTKYKTHYNELLAIINAFNTWRYYPKSYKNKVFIFIDYNKLYLFINLKNPSFYQVW